MAAAGGGGGGQRAVVWFRNDLRLHDNAVVAAVAEGVKDGKLSEVGRYAARRPPTCNLQTHRGRPGCCGAELFTIPYAELQCREVCQVNCGPALRRDAHVSECTHDF